MVHIQLTSEFPEHSESTELKITSVCAMYVITAGMFVKDHDSRSGEPVFVKISSCFPAWDRDTLHQVCCLAVPRAVLREGAWQVQVKGSGSHAFWPQCLFEQITRAVADSNITISVGQ